MILGEEAHSVAVNLKKSENMKVTAGRVLARMWEYVQDPDTDGAQQLANAGLPITQVGLWEMVVADNDFPGEIIGKSFRQCQRLLAIGNATDPAEAEFEQLETKRRKEAERVARHATAVTQDVQLDVYCNNQPMSLEALKGAVKDLSADDFTAFKKWFREFCGA